MTKHIATGAAVMVIASAGIAAAQSTPMLGVNLFASPRIERGAQDALVALISLSAKNSSTAIQVPSIRLDMSFTNGALAGDISDCRVRHVDSMGQALNNGANAVGITSGSTVIPLDVPYVVATGTTATLALTCDISSSASLGGTISMNLVPSAQSATAPGSGTAVNVSVGTTATGADGPVSGTAQIVADATPNTPSVPGVPNTGTSALQNLLLLALAGVTALGGIMLARRIASAH